MPNEKKLVVRLEAAYYTDGRLLFNLLRGSRKRVQSRHPLHVLLPQLQRSEKDDGTVAIFQRWPTICCPPALHLFSLVQFYSIFPFSRSTRFCPSQTVDVTISLWCSTLCFRNHLVGIQISRCQPLNFAYSTMAPFVFSHWCRFSSLTFLSHWKQ